MSNEPPDQTDPAPHLGGDDAEDRIVSALAFLATSAAGDGKPSWKTAPAWQEARLKEWAEDLGLLLDPSELIPQLERGGQEHDVIIEPSRYVKVTRGGYFGFSPGIELDLVPSGEDGRRFHLWGASAYLYLERLRLQNLLTPGLNTLEGVIVQDDDLAICISQPRLDLNPVTQVEIDDWFLSLGFEIITKAAYYRRDDNLGVFDAHDKNVVRSTIDPEVLVPFDVIPVQPDGGFLDFIQEAIDAGGSLQAIRTAHTTTRATS